MAVKTDAVGKTYPLSMYAVGREKVREYALAVGERNPVHLDVQAARRAGYADVVAPPMFAALYSTPAVVMAVFDPDVAMNFAMEVHGDVAGRAAAPTCRRGRPPSCQPIPFSYAGAAAA